MKILCLDWTGGDYLQNQIYDGFVTLFGRKNVIDFPEDRNFSRLTQKTMDVGYKYNPRMYMYKDEFYNDTDGGLRGWSREQILEMAKNQEFDLVLVGFLTELPKWKDILMHCKRIAYVDGSEHGDQIPKTDQTLDGLGKPYYYFKREIRPSLKILTRHAIKVLPLPFAAVPQHNPDFRNDYSQPKQFDLYWRGNSSYSNRPKAWAAFYKTPAHTLFKLGWFDCYTVPIGIVNGNRRQMYECPREQYLRELTSSWVGLNTCGMGDDCYRYWEIPYSGTVMLAQMPRIIIENNYIDGQEAVFFPHDMQGIVHKLQWCMQHKNLLPEIGRKGREKTLKYHTTEKRAEYILRSVGLT